MPTWKVVLRFPSTTPMDEVEPYETATSEGHKGLNTDSFRRFVLPCKVRGTFE